MSLSFRDERLSLKGPVEFLKQKQEETRGEGAGADSEGFCGEGEEPFPGPAFLCANLLPIPPAGEGLP